LDEQYEAYMNAIRSGYFKPNPLKKGTRSLLVIFGILLAGAIGVLVLQSLVYASSLLQLWEAGQDLWGETLSLILQILAIWAFVLGFVFVVQDVTLPVTKYGGEFWSAVVTSFPLGLVLPFMLVLGVGFAIYILLGLLSLLVPDVFAFATLQFAWLAAGYLVFLWIVTGMVPLLAGVFQLGRWYYKFIAILLYIQLILDILQVGTDALGILLNNSIWQTNNMALLAAVFGTLLVSNAAVLWSLRGQPALTRVYAITGIYIASVVTGNFSERLFGWGEVPSAVVALLAPLLYLQAAKWILRRDGTAVAGLAAGYAGLLTGLLLDQLLQLRITGQSWISLLWGIIVVLGLGLALGYFLGRRLTKLVSNRLMLLPVLLKYMDIGLVAGIMAGMFIGGFLAR
jgi:hypothetical protein